LLLSTYFEFVNDTTRLVKIHFSASVALPMALYKYVYVYDYDYD